MSSTKHASRAFGPALLMAAAAWGCSAQQRPAAADGPPPPAPASHGDAKSTDAPPDAATEALSEGQMARLSELVNQAEVEQAKVAQGKAKEPAVKEFADRMVSHHGQALRATASLVNILELDPANSATGSRLEAEAAATLAKLNATAPGDFDKVYVQSQIDGHQKVLDLIDQRLLPAAKRPEVVDSLRFARDAVERHLSQARALQAK